MENQPETPENGFQEWTLWSTFATVYTQAELAPVRQLRSRASHQPNLIKTEGDQLCHSQMGISVMATFMSAHWYFGFGLLPYFLESYNGFNYLNLCLLPYLLVIFSDHELHTNKRQVCIQILQYSIKNEFRLFKDIFFIENRDRWLDNRISDTMVGLWLQ